MNTPHFSASALTENAVAKAHRPTIGDSDAYDGSHAFAAGLLGAYLAELLERMNKLDPNYVGLFLKTHEINLPS